MVAAATYGCGYGLALFIVLLLIGFTSSSVDSAFLNHPSLSSRPVGSTSQQPGIRTRRMTHGAVCWSGGLFPCSSHAGLDALIVDCGGA